MSTSSLEVPRRQRSSMPPKLRRWLVVGFVAALVISWVIWYLKTPDDLPTSTRTVDEVGVVGQDIYVTMLAVGDGFERTLDISEVEVDVTADGDVEVTPKVCRGQSFNVTTDATPFCGELDDAVDFEFTAGDSIVLQVVASEPMVVSIDRIRIAFSEGIRSATKEAGIAGVTLTFAEHAPAEVEDPQPDEGTTERPEQSDRKEQKDKKKGDRSDEAADDASPTA